jgi:hypothetical protein
MLFLPENFNAHKFRSRHFCITQALVRHRDSECCWRKCRAIGDKDEILSLLDGFENDYSSK